MKLSMQMIRAFKEIIYGNNTITKIADALNKSQNRISEILTELEDEGFIVRKREYAANNSRIKFEVSNVDYSILLKKLIYEQQAINFEELMADSKLLFLAAACDDWISLDEASKLSKVSKSTIYGYKKSLQNRGVIQKSGKLYKINGKAWPDLKSFVHAYRNNSKVIGIVEWKYGDEVLFKVNKKDLLQGQSTGLYKYMDYGIKIWIISALCVLPEKKLSKEEVFVHSLFEVDDPRTLHLALVFYLKNKLKYQRVLPVAMKYGKYSMFQSFMKLLKSKDDTIALDLLPTFDRKDFKRIAYMYGINNV